MSLVNNEKIRPETHLSFIMYHQGYDQCLNGALTQQHWIRQDVQVHFRVHKLPHTALTMPSSKMTSHQ